MQQAEVPYTLDISELEDSSGKASAAAGCGAEESVMRAGEQSADGSGAVGVIGKGIKRIQVPAPRLMLELKDIAATIGSAVAGEISALRGRAVEIARGIENKVGVGKGAIGAVGEAIQHVLSPAIVSFLQLKDGAAS